jgi:sec-independent protein translocase protein TatA
MTIAFASNFFGPDTLIILLVIVVFFGAKKLPELAKGMGQAIREFSKAKDGDYDDKPESPKQIS